MSQNVISDKGLHSLAPPVPLVTSTIPAFFNCPNIRRTITGFMFVLLANKLLVIFLSSMTAIKVNICTAKVNLLDICILLPRFLR